MSFRTICWDYDGTLHPYSAGWIRETPADEPPIEGVAELMAAFQRDGFSQVVLPLERPPEKATSASSTG